MNAIVSVAYVLLRLTGGRFLFVFAGHRPLCRPFYFGFWFNVLHVEFMSSPSYWTVPLDKGSLFLGPWFPPLSFYRPILLSFKCLGNVFIEFSLYNSFWKHCVELLISLILVLKWNANYGLSLFSKRFFCFWNSVCRSLSQIPHEEITKSYQERRVPNKCSHWLAGCVLLFQCQFCLSTITLMLEQLSFPPSNTCVSMCVCTHKFLRKKASYIC